MQSSDTCVVGGADFAGESRYQMQKYEKLMLACFDRKSEKYEVGGRRKENQWPVRRRTSRHHKSSPD
jgi:hypothetical protein